MSHPRSLRTRLLLSLSAVVLTAWVTTAIFSYVDARDRIGTMLDEHLVQAAHLLIHVGGRSDAPVRPPAHWGAEHEGHSLVYQGWSDDGRLLFRSANAPIGPLSERAEGFSIIERDGAPFRVYGLRSPHDGVRVQVAEHASFRNELAASVARHLLHPVVFALPVLAALIWLSVRWGLAPLQSLADEVRRREPDNLVPLDEAHAPAEAQPLVVALAALFRRVAASIESGRRFTADAAHELRTPLAAIQTNAEVALASRDDDERQRALTRVTEGTERATRLVTQLLLLARLDARATPPPDAPVRLTELAARHLAEAAPFAASKTVGIGLSEDTDPDALARGDADLLGVMIRNLVDNAIRYTPRGGSVDVSIRTEGERVLLKVSDDGPGVPAEERPRMLERFHRGRGTGAEGSGLGLSIVARIAELHDAELSLGEGLRGRGISVRIGLARALSRR
ncbi:MAG: sensor histidine kinase N-terminal domain-containing protein [Deltaproteobacteria bacterium]|nr:sensor histidine kinase N-terminal domain-containing protein [Deltaproteobacteria bacterium]